MKAENRGRFYREGRFATLTDVVASYNTRFSLQLEVAVARKPAEARHPPPFMVAEGAFAPLPECS